MGIFDEKIAKWSRLTRSVVEDVLLETIKEHEHLAVDMNTSMLDKGIDSDGNKIEPEYTPFTKREKITKGMDPNIVNLKWTNEYREGIFMQTDAFPVVFDSTDWKKDKIDKKYGEVLGLTKPDKGELADEIKDPFTEKIKQIGL
jgi:hypothetical protein